MRTTHPGRRVGAVALLTMIATSAAQAADVKQPCNVKTTKQELSSPAPPPPLLVTLLVAPVVSSNCSSVVAVVKLVGNLQVVGGRKLEGSRPFDANAAQAQLNTARADPSFVAALAAELDGESDSTRRLVLEAALLHDRGHYLARDLLVRQLKGEVPK